MTSRWSLNLCCVLALCVVTLNAASLRQLASDAIPVEVVYEKVQFQSPVIRTLEETPSADEGAADVEVVAKEHQLKNLDEKVQLSSEDLAQSVKHLPKPEQQLEEDAVAEDMKIKIVTPDVEAVTSNQIDYSSQELGEEYFNRVQSIVSTGVQNIKDNVKSYEDANPDGEKLNPEVWKHLQATMDKYLANIKGQIGLKSVVGGIKQAPQENNNFVMNLWASFVNSTSNFAQTINPSGGNNANPDASGAASDEQAAAQPGPFQVFTGFFTDGFANIVNNVNNIQNNGGNPPAGGQGDEAAGGNRPGGIQGFVQTIQQIFQGPNPAPGAQGDEQGAQPPPNIFQQASNTATQFGQNFINTITGGGGAGAGGATAGTPAAGAQGDEQPGQAAPPPNFFQQATSSASQFGQNIINTFTGGAGGGGAGGATGTPAVGAQGDEQVSPPAAAPPPNIFQQASNTASQFGQNFINTITGGGANAGGTPAAGAQGDEEHAPSNPNIIQSLASVIINPFTPAAKPVTAAPPAAPAAQQSDETSAAAQPAAPPAAQPAAQPANQINSQIQNAANQAANLVNTQLAGAGAGFNPLNQGQGGNNPLDPLNLGNNPNVQNTIGQIGQIFTQGGNAPAPAPAAPAAPAQGDEAGAAPAAPAAPAASGGFPGLPAGLPQFPQVNIPGFPSGGSGSNQNILSQISQAGQGFIPQLGGAPAAAAAPTPAAAAPAAQGDENAAPPAAPAAGGGFPGLPAGLPQFPQVNIPGFPSGGSGSNQNFLAQISQAGQGFIPQLGGGAPAAAAPPAPAAPAAQGDDSAAPAAPAVPAVPAVPNFPGIQNAQNLANQAGQALAGGQGGDVAQTVQNNLGQVGQVLATGGAPGSGGGITIQNAQNAANQAAQAVAGFAGQGGAGGGSTQQNLQNALTQGAQAANFGGAPGSGGGITIQTVGNAANQLGQAFTGGQAALPGIPTTQGDESPAASPGGIFQSIQAGGQSLASLTQGQSQGNPGQITLQSGSGQMLGQFNPNFQVGNPLTAITQVIGQGTGSNTRGSGEVTEDLSSPVREDGSTNKDLYAEVESNKIVTNGDPEA